MKNLIFTLLDKKTQRCDKLFTAATIAEAERQFQDAITLSPEHSLLRTHPQDFDLYLLGEIDITTPEIVSTEYKLIINGQKVVDNMVFKTDSYEGK